jgi:hypothetical protein
MEYVTNLVMKSVQGVQQYFRSDFLYVFLSLFLVFALELPEQRSAGVQLGMLAFRLAES